MTVRSKALAIAFVLAAALWPRVAAAEAAPRVRPVSAAAIKAAKSALSRGLVVLVESTPTGELQQVTLFVRIEAPQKLVFDILADPAKLPRMQPAMRDVEVRTKRGSALTYRWVYGDAIARIPGTTAMAVAPPAAVQLRMIDGFGPGEMLYRLYPEGPRRTLVALSMSIDVTRATHPLLRWLSGNSPDFHQAWNLGYGAMALRGIEEVATVEAGGSPPRPSTGEAGAGPLALPGPAEVSGLGPMLGKGRVAIVETDRLGRIAQATVIERVAAPPAALTKVLHEPGDWAGFIRAIRIRRDRATPTGRAFTMSFSFPAFSVSTDMELTAQADGCDLASPSGRLQGSALAFRVAPEGTGSVLTSAARIPLRRGGLILRRMIDDDPNFGHALNAAVLMAMSRSFAQRAEGRR